MDDLFVICRAGEVQEDEARGFVLARLEREKLEPWPILVTCKSGRHYAFENVCPHAGKRLDIVPGEFLDDEGGFLKCGAHGALFDPESGECFAGPCQGKGLTPIDLILDDGDLCVTGVPLTDEDGLDIPDPDAFPEVMITSD